MFSYQKAADVKKQLTERCDQLYAQLKKSQPFLGSIGRNYRRLSTCSGRGLGVLYLLEYIFAPQFKRGTENYVNVLIQGRHEMFIETFDEPLKPVHHFLLCGLLCKRKCRVGSRS